MIEFIPEFTPAIERLLTNLIEWDVKVCWQLKSGEWTREKKITTAIIQEIKNDLSINKLQITLKI